MLWQSLRRSLLAAHASGTDRRRIEKDIGKIVEKRVAAEQRRGDANLGSLSDLRGHSESAEWRRRPEVRAPRVTLCPTLNPHPPFAKGATH